MWLALPQWCVLGCDITQPNRCVPTDQMNLLYLQPSDEMNQLSIQMMEAWGSSEPLAHVYKTTNYHTLKVKLSLYRHGQTLGLQKADVPRISWQSVHEVGKAASPTHRLPLPPGESTPGPRCSWEDYANEKSQWPQWESNPLASDL